MLLLPARALSACAHRFGERARRERLVAQHEADGVGADGIDDQSGERGQMIGAALDGIRPFALARRARSEDASNSASATMPVSGVRMSCAMPASAASIAAGRPACDARRCGSPAACAAVCLAAELRHSSPAPDARTMPRKPRSIEPDQLADIASRQAAGAQLAQARGLGGFRQFAAVGVENQPMVVIARDGRPSSACSSRCTLVAWNRSCPRTTSVTPCAASSTTTDR